MPVGGAEDFAVAMQENLPAGCEVSFVCLRDPGVLGESLAKQGKDVPLVQSSTSKRWSPAGVMRLSRWLRDNRIDVVHSQTYHAHTYAIPAARLAACVSVLHQQKTLQDMPWRRRWTLRSLAHLATRVLALSDDMAADLRETFHLRSNSVRVIPNVVDPAQFFHAAERNRDHLGLPHGPLGGTVASLNSVKNHDATLEMAALLQKQGVRLQIVFIGEGNERNRLTEKIRDMGLAGMVKLVGNQRPVAPWMQSLDVMLLPSHWEGQPLALLQAVACGIPIIASKIDGNIAALGEGHPGLFAPGDIPEYANLVRKVLSEPTFVSTILQFQKLHPPPLASDVASRLYDIYQEILPRP